MAKINKVSRQTTYHRVFIEVDDPQCLFSIKPKIEYMKVFKSTNSKAAIKEASKYCNSKMREYPGAIFKHGTEAEPYNYYDRIFVKED